MSIINLSPIFKKHRIFPGGGEGSIRDSNQYSLVSTFKISDSNEAEKHFPQRDASGRGNTIECIRRRLEINRNTVEESVEFGFEEDRGRTDYWKLESRIESGLALDD